MSDNTCAGFGADVIKKPEPPPAGNPYTDTRERLEGLIQALDALVHRHEGQELLWTALRSARTDIVLALGEAVMLENAHG